ncbi:magnesium and cobalt transport protein CorA [Williamsia sterculiae]|uniref:Magnesium transporter n=1 Tax=Williamsia sterculiae TaxID=1344003 RepID=A0A1N7E1G9_9NOCA|nr:magnesium and cobalt transport protein CorA [Williamsia sterculiae]SIR81795.1 magnesium transporter [Williamsia sterculiae]
MPSLPSLRPSGGRRSRVHAPHIPIPASRAVVDCGVYIDGHRQPGNHSYQHALAIVREKGRGYVWLGLHSPDAGQMEGVAQTFGLHELMVEDAVQAHQRPKLERYDDTLFLVLKTVSYVPHESIEAASEVVETGEIMVFCGPDFVITVRHGDHTQLTGVRASLERRPQLLELGPTAVMHRIADHVVDTYVEVAEDFETDVDSAEDNIFAPKRGWVEIEPIYLLKREIMELRRAIGPLAVPLQRLTSPDNDLMPKEVRRYFRDVQDHHTAVTERITGYDEVLSSLLDAGQAKVNIQQSTDMRKISAWVAIASVPTMVAGIYGMNFDFMPELKIHYYYPVLMCALVVVCVFLWKTFRKNHWL